MYLSGFDRPVFITRVLNNEFKYLSNFPKFDGVITDANIANHYSNPWAKVLEKRDRGEINFLMVDPNTAKLEYKPCVQKKTYQLLSYCPEEDGLTPDDFLDDQYADQFSIDVLDTQAELGANILLTPYFVAKTTKSPWYDVNLKLAQKSIEAKNEQSINQDTYATICLNIADLMNEDSRKKVVNDYKHLDVEGYYILAEGLHDRTSGKEELFSVLKVIEDLSSSKKPVLLGSVDGLGMIASGFGSAGFSAGICWLESFNEANFTQILEGRKEDGMRERFIYIPETFIKFPRDRAQLIYSTFDELSSYKDSKYYSDKSINWNDRARYYFLEKRFEELENLKGKDVNECLIELESRLDEAITLANKIYEEDIRIQRTHLSRWKEAIELAKSE